MPFESEFIEQVLAGGTPIILSTKAELVAYYQEQYPRSWGSRLAQDLAYVNGGNARNIARRFNPDRVQSQPRPGSAQAREYETLGQELGPVDFEPPEEGFEVTFMGEIRISRKCYYRSFIVHIDAEEAKAMIESALQGEADYEDVFRQYFDGENLAEGYCGDPEVIVEPWTEQSRPGRPAGPHTSRLPYAQRLH